MPVLSPPSPRLAFAGLAALALGLLIAVYWPALHGELIWNDPDYVTRPDLRATAGLARIWTEPGATQQYYPLLHGAFWVQARLWGDAPFGYHLVTLVLHALAAVLFGLVLRHLAVPGAWLAALLFAFHPVHVQSVAWISEQKNTLSLVLYLAAALAYLRFDEKRTAPAYGFALFLFTLSLLAKTVTATLPPALLVLAWWKRGRVELRRDVIPLTPWLLIAVAAAAFSTWVEHHFVGASGESFQLSWLDRVLVAGRAWWIYLGHLAWPLQLNFIYPRWTPAAGAALQWLSLLGVIAVGAVLWVIRERQRAPLAVFLLFTGSLVPVLGFVNLYGALYSWVWDHWQYLPDLAPLALLAAGLVTGWNRFAPRAHTAGFVAASVLVLALAALSRQHTALFVNNETLYRLTLERNPSAWMFHNNLALLLGERPGGASEARAHFEEALRLRSGDYPDAHVNYGAFLMRQPGGNDDARAHFEAALRLNPNHAEAHHGLGNVLATMPGRQDDARAEYDIALQLKPGYAEVHAALAGLLLRRPGQESEAITHYEQALRLNPALAIAHNNLANLLAATPARKEDAQQHYAAAIRLQPDYADAHYNLGRLLAAGADPAADAAREFKVALQLQPALDDARIELATLLLKKPGNETEAAVLFEAVLERQPNRADVHATLAILCAQLERWEPALHHAERAVELDPANAQSRQTLSYLRGLGPRGIRPAHP